jgi:ABC-type iron transport system FetAB ATPase subunit
VIPGIRLHSFDLTFPNSTRGLRYLIPASKEAQGLDVWEPRPDSDGTLITTLEVPSGGGKTTLANSLVSFLAGDADGQNGFSWSRSPDDSYAVSMLPQRSATILHWRVGNIVPPQSPLLKALIPTEDPGSLIRRHLSELSGGQVTRVLLASAVERALRAGTKVYYLLLDEPFDGLDSSTGNAVLRDVLEYSTSFPKAPLFRLLLISHFDPQVALHGIDYRRLTLTPQDSLPNTMPSSNITYREVMVDETV